MVLFPQRHRCGTVEANRRLGRLRMAGPFRSVIAAAPLKHDRVRSRDSSRAAFRSVIAAAPLKHEHQVGRLPA